MWYDMPAQGRQTAKAQAEREAAAQSREIRYTISAMGNQGHAQQIPTLIGAARVDWLQLPGG